MNILYVNYPLTYSDRGNIVDITGVILNGKEEVVYMYTYGCPIERIYEGEQKVHQALEDWCKLNLVT